jgi:hypothetical protein
LPMPVPAPVTRATLCDAAMGGPPTNVSHYHRCTCQDAMQ